MDSVIIDAQISINIKTIYKAVYTIAGQEIEINLHNCFKKL